MASYACDPELIDIPSAGAVLRIHKIEVNNFRGIRRAEWVLSGPQVALLGPGDSCKSTLLDAIELVFWPRYALTLSDNDFFDGDANLSVLIRAWVIAPPLELTRDGSYFTHLMGYDRTTDTITPEPSDSDLALGVQLSFHGTMEPEWQVFNERAEPRHIGSADRARFGIARISESVGTNLAWGRGSSLARLSADAQSPISHALRGAARAARSTANTSGAFSALSEITTQIATKAKHLRAIDQSTNLQPALDADVLSVNQGALSLHDPNLPISRHGLGSRRLTSIAAQLTDSSAIRIILVDEVETGLEPHRIRHLLRTLNDEISHGNVHQLLLTTHSPVPLRELGAEKLGVVRRSPEAFVTVDSVPLKLQGLVRAHAEALLAPKVVVCEGATEVGLARALMDHSELRENGGHLPIAAPTDARGCTNVVGYANDFVALGYQTAVICDNDDDRLVVDDIDPSVEVVQTEPQLCIEQQVANDLTMPGLKAFAARGLGSIDQANLEQKLRSRDCAPSDLQALLDGVANEDELDRLRNALGRTAKADGEYWFKSIDGGMALGAIVVEHAKQGTRSHRMATTIVEWCRGD